MRCNIVLHEANRNGIIGKMADRLHESSLKLGIDALISHQPMDDVDVNHFMLFSAACPIRETRNTMMITHLHDARSFSLTKDLLKVADLGICMSRMTEKKLVDYGISPESLCHILPGHDGDVLPRRIKIGLTTHLYDDGRKRENLLVRLGEEIGLQDFQFEIFGLRWRKIAEKLRACGAIVNIYEGGSYYQEDYKQLLEAIPNFDYYLYTGLDEGSMGTLDALSAGVPTIVTKEGFHMDLGVKMDYPFITYEELKAAFLEISSRRNQRIHSVRRLTWDEYAKQHLIVWSNLLEGKKSLIKKSLKQEDIATQVIDGYSGTSLMDKLIYFARIFQADRWPGTKYYYNNKIKKFIKTCSIFLKNILRFFLPETFFRAAVNLRRTWRERLRCRILELKIRLKWFVDKRRLPLTPEHWELYAICHRIFWRELHDFPNLVNPRDFNDRIQWLKLFDQTEAHIQCSDKILVRDYVREKIGDEYLVELYQTCETFEQINFSKLPKSFVIKTNHDNGTVILVKDKARLDTNATRMKIESALNKKFGWELGEWAYSFVPPRILVEEFVESDAPSPPPDYKFQCVEGKVKFCRFTYDRGIDTKEIVVDREAHALDFIIDEHFKRGTNFSRPEMWERMVELAENLSKGFKCVRVDFLFSGERFYVGELTFFPYFGAYKGIGQQKAGVLLDFDRTTFKPPIYHKLARLGRVAC